jgi:aryl-phospho-beta-D-glucosidase BglC (GH1 family)
MINIQNAFSEFKVVGYVPTWGGNLNDVQYTKLTHINYAFMIPNSNGTYQAMDVNRLNSLVSLAHANGVKVIISVGGGGGGDAFRSIVPNASLRTTFVNNMLNFCNTYKVDGVDIDWEYPGDGTEANNFALLMSELSAKMHANGKLCTAAVIAYGGTSITNSVFSSVDFLNIMAYDENSYQHSTYDLGVQSVNYWVGRGLPVSKAILGVPFYGRDNCCAYKTVGYNDILAMGGSPNADTYNNQIGYNGIPTMKKKTNYAMQSAGGIMIWSLDTDVKGPNSLLSAINEVVVANSNPVPDNLAKGKSATASSTESNPNVSTTASNATDGSYNSRWSSLFADPQWLSVDLAGNYSVNRVKITWEAAFAKDFQIQFSNDGNNWTTVKSITGNIAATNDVTGLSGTTRYVRIYGTARATAYGYSMYELEVYGTPIESPYSGTAIVLPGKIEAENYDLGGEGLAYHDIEAANQGGAYRTEGVDIQTTTDVGGGYNVGYTADGEWMKYMVNVSSTGSYNFEFRTASTGSASAIRMEVDGADVTGSIALANTGGWQTWGSKTVSNISLTAGSHIIRLFTVTGGFNINYVNVTPAVANQAPSVSISSPADGSSFTSPASIGLTANASDKDGNITKVDYYNGTSLIGTSTTSPYSFIWNNVAKGSYSISAKATDNGGAVTTSASITVVVSDPIITETPYQGTPWNIPGTIEAENYDNGGEGVAYHDIEAANQGGAYRTDGVDIQTTTDVGGGYNVGYIADGEYLKYTVNVTASGSYDVSFRTASTSASGVIRMEVDGATVIGSVPVPNTGAWQTWSSVKVRNVNFTAGSHIIRLFVVTGGFNINNFSVTTPSINTMSFLRASGKNIVNDNGNFQIKAANLGNFMVQEGYMLNLGGGYQHNIKAKIADVVGAAAADQFYNDYHANYITKGDIDSLAKFGFNAVRLPMHYNLFTILGQPDTFLESGFTLVDNIISWCKANNMYVILDLHATPGGQSSGDICDYIAGQPSLWESAANRTQTIKLWRKFAERYVNETAVGGYDLINETNWTLANNNQLLMQLMKDITSSIRQVDNNHILFIEGNSYANDYNGLTPKWDNNMAYSFHKYWNDNSQGSINFVLAIRDGQNVPIWLGEFGENSNNWIAEAVTIMNNNNIGWAVWPYKKMSSVSSIGSFNQPNNWPALANYINGGTKPTAAAGQAILNELIQNIKVQNCSFNQGYLYALFKQPNNNNTMPFKTVNLPGKVLAVNYDEGKNGYAYNDAGFQNTQYGSSVGSTTSWNNGWYYRNDGVDIQYSTGENGPTIGWTETNDWMNYTVNVGPSGSYTVKVRVAGNGGNMALAVDGSTIINASIPATGGWDTWQTVTLGNLNLSSGKHTIRATVTTAGYNISYFDFSTLVASNQAPSVNISSPSNGTALTAPASITINANASDVDGTVSKVDFYNGSTLLGTDASAPYSFTWSNVAAGTYTLTAKATDNGSAVTTSVAVSITVNAAGNLLPTVSMTSPTSGSSYNAPASVSITATASDADGSVSKVEFYNGSTLIGTSTSAPYSFTWSNVAAGTYSLTAKATDNANGTATTSSVSITVKTVVTNSCAGIPQFVENGGYVAGSKVQNAGNQYQCKPYPYSGWCNGAAWAYAPGTGSYWTDAWILVGSCSSSAKMASTSDATSVNSYPNPFSNTTNLEVTIQEAGNVTLKVFDKTGNLISTISEGNYLPGTYYFTFEGNGLKGDVYVIQLISNDKVSTYKLVKTE